MVACRICGVELIEENWHSSSKRLGNKICKTCHAAKGHRYYLTHKEQRQKASRKYYLENRDSVCEKSHKWHLEHREQANESARKHLRKLRKEVLDAYGNICACCGEQRPEFLSIDHINGGGTRHRQEFKIANMCLTVRKEGFPKDKYRLLCHNCNQSLGAYGYCPHERERIS